MFKSIFIVFLIYIGYITFIEYDNQSYNNDFSKEGEIIEDYNDNYSCNGKVYCSEMDSCEEAQFYQRNCPGTKMDGDGDGIPCERQCGL